MIISRTPFRVSFAGGGTDLRDYYRHEQGIVLSTAINKYMFITVNNLSEFFDHRIRVAYSKVEMVNDVGEIRHPLVREALRVAGSPPGIEIHSMADIPAGTGMGSSSAFTVGLLNALYAHSGRIATREQLAGEACEIEIERVGEPIGKQDQYAAAYGGLNLVRFLPDERVVVEPVPIRSQRLRELNDRLLLLYTGSTRSAGEILRSQKRDTGDKLEVLGRMKALAVEMRDLLISDRPLERFGELLHEGWELKRGLASKISNPLVDDLYDTGRKAGALGGKLLGAGGSGFLLFFVDPDRRRQVRVALSQLNQVRFEFERGGSQIVYSS